MTVAAIIKFLFRGVLGLDRLIIYLLLYLSTYAMQVLRYPYEVAILISVTLALVTADALRHVRRELGAYVMALPISRIEYTLAEYLATLAIQIPIPTLLIILGGLDPLEPYLASSAVSLLSIYMSYTGSAARAKILSILTLSIVIEIGGFMIGIPLYLLPSHMITGLIDLYSDPILPSLSLVLYNGLIWVLLVRESHLWEYV